MSVNDNLRLVDQAWVEGINRHSSDLFLKHHSDNVVVHDPTLPTPLRGRAALKAWFEGLFAMFPDYQMKKLRSFGQENWVCLEGEETGTLKGPIHAGPTSIPPTGKTFRIPSSIICKVESGLIAEVRVYYDVMGLMAQLGLGP